MLAIGNASVEEMLKDTCWLMMSVRLKTRRYAPLKENPGQLEASALQILALDSELCWGDGLNPLSTL